jgi:hypothetical protein
VLEDEAEDLSLADDVQQVDGVVLAGQRHQDLDFAVDLLELDWVGGEVLGLSILTTQRSELRRLWDRKTSEYLPRPIFRSQT